MPPASDAFKITAIFIVVRAEDTVKLSYIVGDENGRENQTKPRWVWSGRHNENDMRCGKPK